MSIGFDPYYTWLAIPPEDQPPHHYRLLGLKVLEENLDVIENAADQKMMHLRTFQSGKHADDSQKLLNELAMAKVTLLDPDKKSTYDAELRSKLQAAKQAEAKKHRQDRALPMAKPLASAMPLEAKPAEALPKTVGPQLTVAAKPQSPRPSSNGPLLIAAAIVALLLLAAGGVAAMLMFAGEEEVAAAGSHDAATNSTDADTDETTAETPPPPVVPPILPPSTETKTPAEEPPATPETPPVDEPDAETTSDDEPADDGGQSATEVVLAETPAAVPQRLPIPDKSTRDAKRKEILSIFPPSEARTFEEKGEYVAQLIRTAGESADDPPAQFALLNLAREQAAEAGQIKMAFAATDQLEQIFEFDAAAVRVASLQQASRAALPPAAKREIIVAGFELINQLALGDQFDDIDTLSDRIMTLARPLRDAAMIKEITDQRRAADDRAAAYRKAQAAFDTLKQSPDDADANLAAGHYLVFAKHDWNRGLDHLSRSSDAALAAAAKSELVPAETSADQEKLGDAWWAAAEAQKDDQAKLVCRAQAVDWYRQAIGDLVGLAKVRVEKRIAEAGDVSQVATRGTGGGMVGGQRDVIYLDDVQELEHKVGWGTFGKHGVGHENYKITVGGVVPGHSLATHGVDNGPAYVTYLSDGTYPKFIATVALPDSDKGWHSHSAITFRVLGNDKVLWTSRPMTRWGDTQACEVDILGVRRLRLEVLCAGSTKASYALWVNPCVSREPRVAAATDEPDLGIFSRDPAELDDPSSSAPAEPDVVFLDDMVETESQTGNGKLGKRGTDGFDGKVRYQGKPCEHSLYLQAKTKASAFAKFQLDNNYETFTATACIMEPFEGEPLKILSPLTFSVIGDGKVLWKSSPLQQQGDGQPVKVNVRTVEELTLQVDCPGGAGGGHALFIEPLLTHKRQPITKPAKKLTVVKHAWRNGEPLVQLAPVAEAFCFFTHLGGNMAGFGEDVGVAAGFDGNWYLGGTSAQGLGMAGVIITGDLRKEFEPTVTKYDWGKGKPAVKMIHSRAGICFLSRVAGAYDGDGEAARVFINPKDGFWYLDGLSNRDVAASALALKLRRNSHVKLECTEHQWKPGDAPLKLLAADDGFAYLSGVSGDFAGGGEWVNVELVDGFWQFSGHTLKPLGARAISVRVK